MYHLDSVLYILLAQFSTAGNAKSTKPGTVMVYLMLKTSSLKTDITS